MDIDVIIASVNAGVYDSSLTKLKEAIEDRLTTSRSERTINDYHIGDTVVFNSLTGTRYMVSKSYRGKQETEEGCS